MPGTIPSCNVRNPIVVPSAFKNINIKCPHTFAPPVNKAYLYYLLKNESGETNHRRIVIAIARTIAVSYIITTHTHTRTKIKY